MKLSELLKGISVVKLIGKANIEIKNVQINSKSINSGSLFICLKGGDYNGLDFIADAEKYGAVAIITEK